MHDLKKIFNEINSFCNCIIPIPIIGRLSTDNYDNVLIMYYIHECIQFILCIFSIIKKKLA
jgi:hypothetical protein